MTNDSKLALSAATKNLDLLLANPDAGYRVPQAHNELAEAYILVGRYGEAMEQTQLAIDKYDALEDPVNHYPLFAKVNKAFCLWRKGELERSVVVLEECLEHRQFMYGLDDTESFK